MGSAERLYAEYADRECSCPTCARYNFAAGRLLRQDCLNACDAEVACTAFMYEVNFFSSNDCYLYSGEGGVRAGSVNTDSDCYVIVRISTRRSPGPSPNIRQHASNPPPHLPYHHTHTACALNAD